MYFINYVYIVLFRAYANVIGASWSLYIKYRYANNMKYAGRLYIYIYIT